MGNIHAIGEAVQITSDETLTWNQIYQTIADAWGFSFILYGFPVIFWMPAATMTSMEA